MSQLELCLFAAEPYYFTVCSCAVQMFAAVPYKNFCYFLCYHEFEKMLYVFGQMLLCFTIFLIHIVFI